MNADSSRESLPEHKSFSSSEDGNCVSCEPKWQNFLISVFVFVWPLIYFWRQVIPFRGEYVGIANDFKRWYYVYKIYLLDHLSHFHIPLWSPAEAAGFPFYSSPLTQTFYPLNLFLVIFYNLAGGYTRLDHQIFTVLGVSIFALGLFFWLRQLNLNLRAVLFATLVMSVSFKMAEILRFPNAVHTAAWYPWILFAITIILQKQSIKELVGYGLLLFFFLICFFTGGYPYYIYYSLFLFLPYLLILLIKKRYNKFFIPQRGRFKNSIFTLLISVTFSLLVCEPYLYEMKRLMKDTVGRGGGKFEFSTKLAFTYIDTIGSLIFPPIANAEGWYYFGILSVLVILLYYFSGLAGVDFSYTRLTPLEKEKNRQWYEDPWVKIFFLVWIGTITYITYGSNSYLFIFLWKFMPFFSSLRAWSRMNIILVPIIAWLLAISYIHFEQLISKSRAFRNKRRAIYVLLGFYVAILIIQNDFFINKLYDNYWNWYFRDVASKDVLFIICGALAFVIMGIILKLSSKINFQSNLILWIVLTSFVLFSVLDMRSVGASMWIYPSPLATPKRYRLNVEQLNRESFTVSRIEPGTMSLSSAFSVGNKNTNNFNWYFNGYVEFLENTETQITHRRKLLGIVDGRKLYFSKTIDYPTIEAFLDDTTQFNNFERVISYTGDELVLKVNVPTEGYLSFIDNWDRDWEATVDSKSTPLERLFGVFKSVRLPPGEHQVIFAYRPKLFRIFAKKLN